MIPFLIKVCGITNVEDGRAALEAGANALGFNFYPKSPRYLELRQATEMVSALGKDYLRVGVFVNPSYEDLAAAAGEVPIDVAQVHGALPERLPAGITFWRALAPAAKPARGEPRAEAYLLDTPSPQFGGTGIAFDWRVAAGFQGRAILAGGLDGGNVEEAIAVAQPWGVDACSRLELSPRRKDAGQVRAFVSAALRGAKQLQSREVTL